MRGGPAPASPTSPMPGVAGPAAGPYMVTPRGPTSRFELAIDWNHPIFQQALGGEADVSRAVLQRQALSAEAAYAYLSQDDERPLLVLRECFTCNGTDDALLTRQADNERTMLMSRWFNCVKLPPDVLEADHPFHALFDSKDPGHLFLASPDGKLRVDLNGQQSRTELWKLMEEQLERAYLDQVKPKLKELQRLLNDFDELDADLLRLEIEIDDKIESGASASKIEKLRRKLAKAENEKAEARARAIAVSAVKLRETKKEAEATAGTQASGES